MMSLLNDAGISSSKTKDLHEKVSRACDICAQTGRPVPKKKISLTHVNQAFNESLQADFLVVYLGDRKYFVLNIICMGTKYCKRATSE